MEWIKTNDELPNQYERILVYNKSVGVVLVEWVSPYAKKEFTHWMPLPKPPKEV